MWDSKIRSTEDKMKKVKKCWWITAKSNILLTKGRNTVCIIPKIGINHIGPKKEEQSTHEHQLLNESWTPEE